MDEMKTVTSFYSVLIITVTTIKQAGCCSITMFTGLMVVRVFLWHKRTGRRNGRQEQNNGFHNLCS